MVKDRLLEFKTDVYHSDTDSGKYLEEEFELIPTSSQEFSTFVSEILPELDEIQRTLEEWNNQQKEMIETKRIHKQGKEELEDKCLLVRKKMRFLKPQIEEMNNRFVELKRGSSRMTELKIICNQYTFVQKSIKDAFELLTCLEIEYKHKIANHFDDDLMKPSHEEITHRPYERIIEKPVIEVVDETELRTIMETKPLLRAKSIKCALKEIKKRNDQIHEVEEKVILLHEMMEDMSYFVEMQGEIGERVEKHTEETKIIMDKVDVEMEKTIETQKATNDKLCAIMAIISCLLLVFLLMSFPKLIF